MHYEQVNCISDSRIRKSVSILSFNYLWLGDGGQDAGSELE
jgi:hypothetical protein